MNGKTKRRKRKDNDCDSRRSARKARKPEEDRPLGTGRECAGCGKIVFNSVFKDGKWYGRCCLYLRAYTKSTFPFVTSNVDGKPMVINSLRHMRKVEQQHGVQFHAYAFDEKNFKDPPQQDPSVQDVRRHYEPVFGQSLEEVRR